MRPLTHIEKTEHSDSLKDFARIINEKIIPHKGEIELVEVGYGVPIDDEYFYFDWPYNDSVDKFNEDLANPDILGGIDVKMHGLFYDLQKKKKNGYIHFEYDVNLEEYSLYSCATNLGIDDRDEDLTRFLPIMHCAATLETSYLFTVKRAPKPDVYKQLLILSKTLAVGANEIMRKNVVVTAFIIHSQVSVNETLVNNLHEEVIGLIEKYFKSPVLEKILEDRRRSEILTYEHSLYNLRFDAALSNLKKKIQLKKYDGLLNVAEELEQRLNVLHINLYGLFHTEKKALPDDTYPLFEKTIPEIVNYFIAHLNFKKTRVDVQVDSSFSGLNILPALSKLLDVQIVLWNLWTNAYISSGNRNAVQIRFKDVEGFPAVEFRNHGEMQPEFVQYLSSKDAVYPREKENDRPYRGLEIISDKLNQNNWALRVKIDESNSSEIYTEITLIFKTI